MRVSLTTVTLVVALLAVVSGRRKSFDKSALEKLLGGRANLKFGSGRQHPILHHANSQEQEQEQLAPALPSRRGNRLKPFNFPQQSNRVTSRQADVAEDGNIVPVVENPEEIDTETMTQIYGFNEDDTAENNDLPEGHVCFQKLMLVEEIKYEDVVTCNHISEPSCFDTYKTVMKKVMDQKCKTDFMKECVLKPRNVVKTSKYTVCHENYVRDCDAPTDREICTKEYNTVCTTTHEANDVETNTPNCITIDEEICMPGANEDEPVCKVYQREQCDISTETDTLYSPRTECSMLESEVCGPETCPLVRAEPVCEDKIEEFVIEVMDEVCHLTPRKTCSDIVRMIPGLERESVCSEVSREVCGASKRNPTRVSKPVVKKWCGPEDQLEELRTLERARRKK